VITDSLSGLHSRQTAEFSQSLPSLPHHFPDQENPPPVRSITEDIAMNQSILIIIGNMPPTLESSDAVTLGD
jgi:hypothetical protein